MKGFPGITGHYILDWCMESIMVSCKRFKGQYCAENIRQEYEAVACYNIAKKITNIVTDNATNMTKALPGFTSDRDTKDYMRYEPLSAPSSCRNMNLNNCALLMS
jgi:hypothetical protein